MAKKKRRSNNEGSIYFDESKKLWRAQITPPVGNRLQKYAHTEREAREWLQKMREEIAHDTYIVPDKQTFGQWLDTWVTVYHPINTRESTQKQTKMNIETNIKPILGKIPLQKLRPEDIQDAVVRWQKEGKKTNTIRRIYTTVHQACRQAYINGRIQRNPCDFVTLPKGKTSEVRALTAEEKRKLCAVLTEMQTVYARAMLFQMETGLRVGEVIALHWHEVDHDHVKICYSHSGSEDTEPKTEAGKRTISAKTKVHAILEQQRMAQKQDRLKAGSAWEDTGYVFTNALGRALDHHNINRVLRTACTKAGIEPRSSHNLRHTFASMAVKNGVDPVTLARILGHTNAAFTMRTYCHSDQKRMDDAMQIMDDASCL